MAILNRGFLHSGFYARAYRKLLHSIYVNDLWLDLRLHAKREAVEYIIAHMSEAMVLPDRDDLARFALARAPKEGLVLEFGVAKGASLRNLATQNSPAGAWVRQFRRPAGRLGGHQGGGWRLHPEG